MVVFKDFTVEVRSGGVELPTFDDPDAVDQGDAEPNTIIKYVEANANSEFSLYMCLSRTFTLPYCDSVIFTVISDGVYLDNRRIPFGHALGADITGLESKDSTGRWMSHPLRFGPLRTFEGNLHNGARSDPARYAEIGCIKVDVQGCKMIEKVEPNATLKDLPSAQKVPEKCFKKSAADLGTGLGAAHHIAMPVTRHKGVYKGKPVATFKILYRSRDNLQMLSVIPRSPSPVPLEDRPIEQLSVAELHELVRRQRVQILQSHDNIKTEDGKKPVVKEKRDQAAGQDFLDSDGNSDVEVVLSKKRKIEVVELSDEE